MHFCTLTSSPFPPELQPSIVFMEDKISLIMEKREYVFLTLKKELQLEMIELWVSSRGLSYYQMLVKKNEQYFQVQMKVNVRCQKKYNSLEL